MVRYSNIGTEQLLCQSGRTGRANVLLGLGLPQTIFTHTDECTAVESRQFDRLWDRDRDIDISRLHVASKQDRIDGVASKHLTFRGSATDFQPAEGEGRGQRSALGLENGRAR
jgi:hypothetical protein